MPDIFNRASILGSFRMDPRLQLAGMTAEGWIPATNMQLRQRNVSFPTFFIGNLSWICSDGSPPTTCGDDEKNVSFPTLFSGNPSPAPSVPTFFIGNLPCHSRHLCYLGFLSDGSPPTTCGDDRRGMDTRHKLRV